MLFGENGDGTREIGRQTQQRKIREMEKHPNWKTIVT